MSDLTENLGARTATGAAWLAGQMAITRVLGFISQLVLTWLLMPEDFGRLGLVWTITAFASQLVDPGIDDVLLQRRAHFNRWATPAFWLSVTCGVAGMVGMILAAIAVMLIAQQIPNKAYSDPTLVKMVAVMALGSLFSTLGSVPLVKMRADMRFARLAAIGLVELVILQVLSIVLAAAGAGSYSLVVPVPIVSAGRTISLWLMARPRVRMHLQFRRWGSLIGSTGWVFGQRLLQSLVNQGDYLILGALFADQVIVGLYFFAYMLSMQLNRMLSENLTAALTPALSALHLDVPRMESAAIRAARAVAAVMVPLGILQILLAGPIVRLLFAAKWEPAIPLIRYLSCGILLLGPAWPLQSIITATGRFRAGFFMRLGSAICFVIIVTAFTWMWRETGTAIGVGLWGWVTGLIIATVTLASPTGALTLLNSVSRPLLAGVPGIAIGSLIVWRMPTTIGGDIATGVLVTSIHLGCYFTILRLLDRPMVETLTKQVRTVILAFQAYSPWAKIPTQA